MSRLSLAHVLIFCATQNDISEPWQMLLLPQIDPAGLFPTVDFAECSGMDDYESVAAAFTDIAHYDAAIVGSRNAAVR